MTHFDFVQFFLSVTANAKARKPTCNVTAVLIESRFDYCFHFDLLVLLIFLKHYLCK